MTTSVSSRTLGFVIPDLIRDPVLREHWIAGQARNDNFCVIPDRLFVIPDRLFVIPDRLFVIPDLIRDPVPRIDWIADQVRNDSPHPQGQQTPAMTHTRRQ